MTDGNNITADLEVLRLNPGRVTDLYRQLKVTLEHPTLKLPSAEDVIALLGTPHGPEHLRNGLVLREKTILLMKEDPLRHGYELRTWKDADGLLSGEYFRRKGLNRAKLKDIVALGGNRAAKSEWAAKRCVQTLVNTPGANVWCLSTTSKSSKRDQQKLIWKFLPPEWKNLKKTNITRITYNPKDGFADDAFVLPNGSECQFMNYKQDRDVIEGGQVDLWWADELVPVDWVVTLRGRTIDRHGQGIVTFTPVRGCSATVAEYITGAKVVEWTDCELLADQQLWPGGRPGQVPYIMECLNPEHAVIYFQSKWNPFIDYEELKKLWGKRSRTDILVRLHGVTDRRTGNVFPRFGTHNIIPHAKIPLVGTNYFFGDFAWNRKWFLLWFRCTEDKGKKRIYIYREWPDRDTYGEWAVASEKPDGERGPAQETLGYSINDYKRLVLSLEQRGIKEFGMQLPETSNIQHSTSNIERAGEEIFRRRGDPRSGAVVSLQEEGTTSIFEMLNDEKDGLPGLEVYPVEATGTRRFIGEGINLFNQWLEYDDDRPLGLDNEPMLYISERCGNVRECLKLYTGGGGEKGACKDPVDLLRYAAVSDIEYVAPGAMEVTGGMG